jgi:hypothetical protein
MLIPVDDLLTIKSLILSNVTDVNRFLALFLSVDIEHTI